MSLVIYRAENGEYQPFVKIKNLFERSNLINLKEYLLRNTETPLEIRSFFEPLGISLFQAVMRTFNKGKDPFDPDETSNKQFADMLDQFLFPQKTIDYTIDKMKVWDDFKFEVKQLSRSELFQLVTKVEVTKEEWVSYNSMEEFRDYERQIVQTLLAKIEGSKIAFIKDAYEACFKNTAGMSYAQFRSAFIDAVNYIDTHLVDFTQTKKEIDRFPAKLDVVGYTNKESDEENGRWEPPRQTVRSRTVTITNKPAAYSSSRSTRNAMKFQRETRDTRPNPRGREVRYRDHIACFHCGERNHIPKDCYYKYHPDSNRNPHLEFEDTAKGRRYFELGAPLRRSMRLDRHLYRIIDRGEYAWN